MSSHGLPPAFFAAMGRATEVRAAEAALEAKQHAIHDALQQELAARRERIAEIFDWARILGPLATETGVETDIDIVDRAHASPAVVESGWKILEHTEVSDSSQVSVFGSLTLNGVWLTPGGKLREFVGTTSGRTQAYARGKIVTAEFGRYITTPPMPYICQPGVTDNPIGVLEQSLFNFVHRNSEALGLQA